MNSIDKTVIQEELNINDDKVQQEFTFNEKYIHCHANGRTDIKYCGTRSYCSECVYTTQYRGVKK